MSSAAECTAGVGTRHKIVGIMGMGGMVVDVLLMMIAVMDSSIDAAQGKTLFVGEWSRLNPIVPEEEN
jgi:hypothetical protein